MAAAGVGGGAGPFFLLISGWRQPSLRRAHHGQMQENSPGPGPRRLGLPPQRCMHVGEEPPPLPPWARDQGRGGGSALDLVSLRTRPPLQLRPAGGP